MIKKKYRVVEKIAWRDGMKGGHATFFEIEHKAFGFFTKWETLKLNGVVSYKTIDAAILQIKRLNMIGIFTTTPVYYYPL